MTEEEKKIIEETCDGLESTEEIEVLDEEKTLEACPEEVEDFDDDEEIDEDEEEIRIMEESIKNASSGERSFGKVDNKHEFASEIINANSIKKSANLDSLQIVDLVAKRQFVNTLNILGWNKLAEILTATIGDVEDYSLSKDGILVKHVLVDHTRQTSSNYEGGVEGKK